MSTARTLALYGGGLAAAFAAALALGAAVEPLTAPAQAEHADAGHGMDPHAPDAPGAGRGDELLPGLVVTQDGYTLVPARTTLPAGSATDFRFSIVAPDGTPVTDYTPEHEKDLHLIVVRRDLAGFQHVHPVRDARGSWSVPLSLPAGGTYRVFADFVPAELGRGLTLGTDIAVAGDYVPVELPAATASTRVDDVEVSVEGAPVAGRETQLTFTLNRGGRPVTDLEPYLGAYGHLVSLRVGDLAYLHTHPADHAGAGPGGPRLTFATTFPSAGTYRLFLDFVVGGQVRTAELTVAVPSTGTAEQPAHAAPSETSHAH